MVKNKSANARFNLSSMYYFFLGFCLLGRGIQYAVSSFFGVTFNMFIVGVPLFILAVLSIVRTSAFKINIGNLLIFIIAMAAYGTSFLTSGDISSTLNSFKDFVQVCLLLILGCFFVIDYERLFNTCKYFSFVSAVLYEIMIFTRSAGMKNYMGFGYNFLLIISFLVLYSHFYNKRFLFVLTILMSMQLLLYGPRMGWLLVAILYLVVIFDKIKQVWIKAAVAVSAGAIALNYKNIILGIVNWLYYNTNISTVTLYRFKYSLDSSDSSELLFGSRYSLIVRSLELIKEHPLFGIGIGGFAKKSGFPFDYPHNILLEIVLDFGIVVGIVVILLISGLILKTVFDKRVKENHFFYLLIVWLLINFLRLFVSQSYICETVFYAVICLAANYWFSSKYQQRSIS